jgi:hypothetical protein
MSKSTANHWNQKLYRHSSDETHRRSKNLGLRAMQDPISLVFDGSCLENGA